MFESFKRGNEAAGNREVNWTEIKFVLLINIFRLEICKLNVSVRKCAAD
jgi:hypothetical protein